MAHTKRKFSLILTHSIIFLGFMTFTFKNVYAQNVLWSYEMPADGSINTGGLLDVGFGKADVVVLGITAFGTSAQPEDQTFAVGLSSINGATIWTAPLTEGDDNAVLSVQSIGDRNDDRIEDAIVAVKTIGTSIDPTPADIEYFVLDGLSGSITELVGEVLNGPIPVPSLFEPLRGDFNGDGNKNNFLYRSYNQTFPFDQPGSKVEAIE